MQEFLLRQLGALICALLFVATSQGSALAASSVYLEELTWTELKAQIAAGRNTIIVPVGGTEQNGPFIALGKHNIRVKRLAGQIASTLGDALVAPTLAYVPEGKLDPPEGHLRWPGTITIPVATFRTLLESAARSFRLHGFRTIVFIGDHGSYQADLGAVAAKLNRQWAGSAKAIGLNQYYDTAQIAFSKLLAEKGFTEKEIGQHAGLNDTAMMLAVDPGLVRLDALRASTGSSPGDGTNGDARRATAELGRLGVELVVNASVTAIRQLRGR